MIMHLILVSSSLIICCSAQHPKSSRDAAILSEARYLAVTGQFGSAYKQEDGVEFKEESDDQGNRKGSYSYIDPNGIRRTVSYTAGKDGFRASGDHLPVPVPPPAAPPLPPLPQPAAPQASPSSSSDDGQYNPADDYDDSPDTIKTKNYQNQFTYDSSLTNGAPSFAAAEFQYNAVPHVPRAPQIAQTPFNPLQYHQYQHRPNVPFHQISSSTEIPHPSHRFLPPGKLSVSRSPEGYSYTFNQV